MVDMKVEVKVGLKVDIKVGVKVILRIVRGVVKVEKSVGVFLVRIRELVVVFKFLVFKLGVGDSKKYVLYKIIKCFFYC